MKVIKRNSLIEDFNKQKIVNAIDKAIMATKESNGDNYKERYNSLISNVLKELDDKSQWKVEDIQDIVENNLMKSGFYDAAKAYILYREKHKEARLVREKINYIKKYSQSKENAASNSNTDANANSSVKNVASIEMEVFKDKNRLIQRQMMKDELNKLYPDSSISNDYAKDLESHIIYVHDEANSPIQKAYCGAYTLYPLMTKGVGNIDYITPFPPNDIQSFSGQVTNLVFALSAQSKGAVALGDYMIALNYYIVAEYGRNYYEKLDANISNSNVVDWQKHTIRRSIKKGMKQFIYGINQPQGNRGFQSPFTNINIFDKYYFQSMFGEFYYPDGTQPQWEAIDCLQRIFIDLLREIRLIKPVTFPVTTFALLYDDNGYKDKEYADFCAEEWAKGSSHFLYHSDNADSLSSCCFSKDTKVLWKNSYDGVKNTTLEELHNVKWDPYKKNLRIFHNGAWLLGKSIKLPKRPMYKVILENNKEIIVSDNHINVTYSGEKMTSELTTSDYLMFNTKALEAVKENDEHLTYNQGILIGAFLGDGSFGQYFCKDGTTHHFTLSLNKEKWEKLKPVLEPFGKFHLEKIVNNVYRITCYDAYLSQFIAKWTTGKQKNIYSYNKCLNLNCLLQSKDFRSGILEGWYITDGGNSNRCYTVSKNLVEDMEILCTSLGKQCVIDISDRTEEKVVIREQVYDRNYPLYCLRWYDDTNARLRPESGFTWKNNSIYWKIKSIEKISYSDDIYCIEMNNQDEPYFTLPCGLITHNCRVSNKINENTFSSTTGMTGVMTGSCNVITLNINRIIQDFFKSNKHLNWEKSKEMLANYLHQILDRVYKYHIAYKTMLYELEDEGMITYSTAGYLYIKKLYSTIGVLGYYEAAKYLGLEDDSPEYTHFMAFIMKTISDYNKEKSIHDKKRPFVFNLEAVPGENLAVKLYNWDKKDGYVVPNDQNLYDCYFFNPWKEENILSKIKLHGGEISKASDGGQGCHINLSEHLSKKQYLQIMDVARKEKCNYFTFNIPMSECEDCHHIVNAPIKECPICHSKRISYYTRIIGFLTKVSNWSKERQKEFTKRYFGNA